MTRPASRSGNLQPPGNREGQAPPSRVGLAVALLALVGAAVAGYLTWHKLFGTELWCAGWGSCDRVNASPYSVFLGVPVALWGLGTYLALAGLGLYWWRRGPAVPAWVPLAVTGITAGGWVYSAYLTWVEARVLHAYCLWCLASFGVITLLVVTGVGGAAAALRAEAPEEAPEEVPERAPEEAKAPRGGASSEATAPFRARAKATAARKAPPGEAPEGPIGPRDDSPGGGSS